MLTKSLADGGVSPKVEVSEGSPEVVSNTSSVAKRSRTRRSPWAKHFTVRHCRCRFRCRHCPDLHRYGCSTHHLRIRSFMVVRCRTSSMQCTEKALSHVYERLGNGWVVGVGLWGGWFQRTEAVPLPNNARVPPPSTVIRIHGICGPLEIQLATRSSIKAFLVLQYRQLRLVFEHTSRSSVIPTATETRWQDLPDSDWESLGPWYPNTSVVQNIGKITGDHEVIMVHRERS